MIFGGIPHIENGPQILFFIKIMIFFIMPFLGYVRLSKDKKGPEG